MSAFELNILPFHIINKQASISFSPTEKTGYSRIFKGNLPKNFPSDLLIERFGWWKIGSPDEGDIELEVDLIENRRFAKNFFNRILFDHFFNLDVITNQNFINDTEVYVEDATFHNPDYKKY